MEVQVVILYEFFGFLNKIEIINLFYISSSLVYFMLSLKTEK